MQTSKSYVGRPLNTDVKLELDDLEYVLSDGQNLIINPESTTDDADEPNVVYADGSETVVLESGGKHYIQMGGETYLLGTESDNIQQLLINADDQSEESNSGIEYIENDVVYKLAEEENETEDEPQAKRFKIGNTEYVTINDTNVLQVSDDNQLSVLNENSMSESSAFQYAILSDGKLHFQLCDNENIEVLNEGSNDDKQNINDIMELPEDEQEYIDITDKVEEYIDVTDKVQEYMLVNTNLTNQTAVKMRKIAAGEVVTGKTVSLDDYLNQMQYKIGGDDTEDVQPKRKNRNKNYEQFLNKKLLIRKNSNGKSLFGKILHIKPAKRKIVEEKSDAEINPEEPSIVTDLADADIGNCNSGERQESEAETVDIPNDDIEASTDVSYPTLMEYNKNVTKEHVNFLTKTLYGLVDMPSLKKKLMDHGLEIVFVEQKLDDDNQEISKDVHYISGYMESEKTEFVLSNSIEQKNVTSLTVIACSDPNNQRTTKVIFHEGTFKSMGLLHKRTQTYYVDKMLNCNFCHEKFANHVLLKEHKESSVHYFSCDKCKKKFTTQSNLYRHRHVHDSTTPEDSPRRIPCVICKTGFSNVSSLSKHLATHNHIKPYHCDFCGKSFMTFGDLNVHRKVHNPSKTYYCDICGREFSRHSNLLRHTEIHKGEGDLYKCGICDCSYKFISSLTRHIVQNHMKQSKID